MAMYEFSCLFHYGDTVIGSSGLIYFASIDKFDNWFQNSKQIQWAILVKNENGSVVTSRNRPATDLPSQT